MRTISPEELHHRLETEHPENSDPRRGFALVNVLKPEDFLAGHIPGSINIPKGHEKEFDRRFEHSKEIIVYCASVECPASAQVAEDLINLGFRNVKTYEGGMAEWSEENYETESGESTAQEMNIA